MKTPQHLNRKNARFGPRPFPENRPCRTSEGPPPPKKVQPCPLRGTARDSRVKRRKF